LWCKYCWCKTCSYSSSWVMCLIEKQKLQWNVKYKEYSSSTLWYIIKAWDILSRWITSTAQEEPTLLPFFPSHFHCKNFNLFQPNVYIPGKWGISARSILWVVFHWFQLKWWCWWQQLAERTYNELPFKTKFRHFVKFKHIRVNIFELQ
jgi:hypothetical protein